LTDCGGIQHHALVSSIMHHALVTTATLTAIPNQPLLNPKIKPIQAPPPSKDSEAANARPKEQAYIGLLTEMQNM
jgi:hypothetical protein